MSKTIKINTDFFKISSSKKTRKNTNNEPLFKISSSLKQEYIDKVKRQRQSHAEKSILIPVEETITKEVAASAAAPTIISEGINVPPPDMTALLSDDFDDCFKYLSENDKKTPAIDPTLPYKIDSFPYGCLSGGVKPTYKKYKQLIEPKTTDELKSIDESKIFRPMRTSTRNLTLGRSKLHRKISVLIKNKDTRSRIKHAETVLKSKSAHEAKKYLRQRNLLKFGSFIPDELAKQMYEFVMLTGDITNTNKSHLIDKFLNDGSSSSS
jgi:hypothetical protein